MIKVGDTVKHKSKGDTLLEVIAVFDDWISVYWEDSSSKNYGAYLPEQLIKVTQIKSSRS